MAQYQLSFESTPLDTYPAELTRRWNTGNAAPSVKEASNALGFTRCLENLLSANTRQLDTVNAIDADPDRADVKFRTLVYVGEASATTTTPVWACVARASGGSGTETGYVLTITKYSGNFRLGLVTYKAGAAASTVYGSSDLAWTPDTWYLAEGSISGSDPVAIEFRLYALTDLVNPVSSLSRTDSSADKITAAGWVGFGRFGTTAVSRFSYASFATGTSELATDPWDAEPDTTAPTLTLPSATPTGTTTASGSVTTNEANGTLYYLASANATETAATIKAGSSQAVSASGVQNVTITGLTAATPYYPHYLHRDAAGNDSAVASGAQFTTAAAGDTTNPTLTGSVTFSSVTQTGYTAQWPAGSDNVAVTGYEYQIGGTAGAWTDAGNNLSAAITGRTAGTTETVYVRAYDAAGNRSSAISGQATTASVAVVKGVTLTLHTGDVPQANLTNLRALWWDAVSPDGTAPDYFTATAGTDASGVLTLDIDAATTLSVGDYGYLHVHKVGTLGNLYKDALVFAGAVPVEDIA